LLYGDSEEQQEAALAAPDPTALAPVAASLTRLSEILADLASPAIRGLGQRVMAVSPPPT